MKCRWSWFKLGKTRYKKTKNSTAASEELGAKAGCCACVLHTTPSKWWANHLSLPSSPTAGPTPNLSPCMDPACPQPASRASRGTCY